MRYLITFANYRVGQSDIPPFEVDTPDGLAGYNRTADVSRHIRDRIVRVLAASPAPGALDARAVIAERTNVLLNLAAGEGSVHYGTSTLGQFNIRPLG